MIRTLAVLVLLHITELNLDLKNIEEEKRRIPNDTPCLVTQKYKERI